MDKIIFTVSTERKIELKEAAKKKGLTLSAFIKVAIADYLSNQASK